MTNWTSGYVADIGYTFGYYPELNPHRSRIALLSNGFVLPEFGTACELGFGQGLSANLHAAAGATQWYGTDFNPAQASFAQEMAAVSGANATLYDDAFADFAARQDLPDFDFIGLHGIWSWISDDNRAVLVDFVRRKLKVGGVLYVSYNTLPGWAAFAPMRHLMTEHAEIIGAAGRGIVSRINDAVGFADKLLATNPLFARANPLVAERIKKIKDQNRHYLAHEYFNKDWHPMHFATMAEWLEPAKVQYAGSGNFLDYVDTLNLTQQQQAFLKDIPDDMFRESVRDFMVNQQFRKDYWIKGARKLSGLEQAEALHKERIILISHRADISLKVTGALGEANMSEALYTPVLDLLADHKPRTLHQVEQAVQDKGIHLGQLLQIVQVLTGIGHVVPALDEKAAQKAKARCEKINDYLLQHARSYADISYLCSPVAGGGITVSRFQQLFLLALNAGKKQPQELAQFAWLVIGTQNQKLIKEGKTLETPAENLAELEAQAKTFLDKALVILKALHIA